MIDDGLRPVVIEFVTEMLNDPHCESVMLDSGEDAAVGSGLPASIWILPESIATISSLSWEMNIRGASDMPQAKHGRQ